MATPLLQLPEFITEPLPVETRPQQVKEWLVSLPAGNLIETGRAINDALTTLNRIKLDDGTRYKLLEHYQLAIDLLDAPLAAAYGVVQAPAKDKSRQAASLARNLQLELALGYKRVLQDRLAARFSLGKRHLPELVQQTLNTYLKLMWVCCYSYSAVPAGAWEEVHKLFHYAITQKWLDLPDLNGPKHSIGGLYRQMLLLALVDPFRFTASEHIKLTDLITTHAPFAAFLPLSQVDSQAGVFLVRLNVDAAPQYFSQRPYDVDASNAILLDTTELVRQLQKVLHTAELKLTVGNDKARALAWVGLLQRVAQQWTITPKRMFSRIRADSMVDLVPGLRLAAYYLNDGNPLLQPQALDENNQELLGEASMVGGHYAQPDGWRVLNESAGGLALRLQGASSACTYRVGDILGLREHGSAQWMLATLRWLQCDGEQDAIECGVQVLAPSGRAALIRPSIADESDAFHCCVLLPAVASLKQAALIAAPHGSFAPGRELLVLNDAGEQLLRASRLHEQTVGYELFEYQMSC